MNATANNIQEAGLEVETHRKSARLTSARPKGRIAGVCVDLAPDERHWLNRRPHQSQRSAAAGSSDAVRKAGRRPDTSAIIRRKAPVTAYVLPSAAST